MPIKRVVALILCLIAVFADVYLTSLQSGDVEYTVPALAYEQPAQGDEAQEKKPSALQTAMKALDTSMSGGAWSGFRLTGMKSGAELVSDIKNNASARLCGLYGADAVSGMIPRFGRLLYPEEIASGARVALIDETLAVKLFRAGDAVGRILHIGDNAFTVVGVLRASRMPGDQDAYCAYVPLPALDALEYQTDILVVSVSGGTENALALAAAKALPGGRAVSLTKEKYRALLPARICGAVAGFALALYLVRILSRRVKNRFLALREKLRDAYARVLLPRALPEYLLYLLAYAALAACFYFLVEATLDPVYVFPEWVPAVPVEPNEIIKTFWTLRAGESALIEYRTPTLLTLRFLREWMTVFSVASLILFVPLIPRKKRARKEEE